MIYVGGACLKVQAECFENYSKGIHKSAMKLKCIISFQFDNLVRNVDIHPWRNEGEKEMEGGFLSSLVVKLEEFIG